MSRRTKDEATWLALTKVSGALFGVDLIVLIQLIGLPSLSKTLIYAPFAFAIALPTLGFTATSRHVRLYMPIELEGTLIGLGTTFSLFGIALLVLHLSLKAGLVFILLMVTGWIVITGPSLAQQPAVSLATTQSPGNQKSN